MRDELEGQGWSQVEVVGREGRRIAEGGGSVYEWRGRARRGERELVGVRRHQPRVRRVREDGGELDGELPHGVPR